MPKIILLNISGISQFIEDIFWTIINTSVFKYDFFVTQETFPIITIVENSILLLNVFVKTVIHYYSKLEYFYSTTKQYI